MSARNCFMLLALCICCITNLVQAQKCDVILTSQTLQADNITSPVLHSDCSIFPQVWSARKEEKRFTAVDIKSQHLACYESGRLVRVCDICTAKQGEDSFENLIGDWTAIKKNKEAVSSIWFDETGIAFKMPWAVAIGGGYWIHQGTLPGYPASHGCIRMRTTNAEWYFNWSHRSDKGCSYANFKTSLEVSIATSK